LSRLSAVVILSGDLSEDTLKEHLGVGPAGNLLGFICDIGAEVDLASSLCSRSVVMLLESGDELTELVLDLLIKISANLEGLLKELSELLKFLLEGLELRLKIVALLGLVLVFFFLVVNSIFSFLDLLLELLDGDLVGVEGVNVLITHLEVVGSLDGVFTVAGNDVGSDLGVGFSSGGCLNLVVLFAIGLGDSLRSTVVSSDSLGVSADFAFNSLLEHVLLRDVGHDLGGVLLGVRVLNGALSVLVRVRGVELSLGCGTVGVDVRSGLSTILVLSGRDLSTVDKSDIAGLLATNVKGRLSDLFVRVLGVAGTGLTADSLGLALSV